jgi:23S rRNA (guanosine2251-2'-O)-methyltransferase
MIVYGKNTIYQALVSKKLTSVYLQMEFDDEKILDKITKDKIKITYKSKYDLDKLTHQGTHQGIVGDIGNYTYANINNCLTKKEIQTVVLLANIVDPHNFGAIARVCECSGIKTIIIPKYQSVEVTPTVIHISQGAVFSLNIVQMNLNVAINYLKEQNFLILGLEAKEESLDYLKVPYEKKNAIIIGSEGNGIPPLITSNCHYLVKLPLQGLVNSLNASTACAVISYHILALH